MHKVQQLILAMLPIDAAEGQAHRAGLGRGGDRYDDTISRTNVRVMRSTAAVCAGLAMAPSRSSHMFMPSKRSRYVHVPSRTKVATHELAKRRPSGVPARVEFRLTLLPRICL